MPFLTRIKKVSHGSARLLTEQLEKVTKMQFPRSILVVICGPKIDQRALEKALIFAEKGNTGIHFLKVDFEPVTELTEVLTHQQIQDIRARQLAKSQQYLHKISKDIQQLGIRCDQRVIWHRNFPLVIEETVRLLTPDLVIKPCSINNANPMAMPVERHLLRYCEAPMLLLSESAPSTGPILAAIDPTTTEPVHKALNQSVLQCSKMMSHLTGIDWHVISAFADIHRCSSLGDMGSIKTELAEQIQQWHKYIFDLNMDGYRLSEDNLHLRAGTPEEQIPLLVNSIKAQLLVIGTMGKCGVPEGYIGNTAERILSQLNCDVLALQPDQLAHVDALL